MDKIDLEALYLSGTYCHKTGTRPPSCQAPRQPTIYTLGNTICGIMLTDIREDGHKKCNGWVGRKGDEQSFYVRRLLLYCLYK